MKNENLRKARLEKKLTQEQLANILGYKGKQSIANWENGRAHPSLHKAIRVSEVLDKPVFYLFGNKKNLQYKKEDSSCL